MSVTGQRNTSAEMRIRRRLHAMGFRYRVDFPVLRGSSRRADIVFTRARVVVYVDGCFWHGCPKHASWPKSNAEFWRDKIETNQRRDRDTDDRLATAGWEVIRIWEHEDPDGAAELIARSVRSRLCRSEQM